ncbi:hypothetical protein ACFLW6_04190 [Chloroflexota bacterium]
MKEGRVLEAASPFTLLRAACSPLLTLNHVLSLSRPGGCVLVFLVTSPGAIHLATTIALAVLLRVLLYLGDDHYSRGYDGSRWLSYPKL